MKILLEIRAAEGGNDAKLFVEDLASAYFKLAIQNHWKALLVSKSESTLGSNLITISFSGKKVDRLLDEVGGHRIQRTPPTERKGRVHTSTVTVAVLDNIKTSVEINDDDFEAQWFSGTGKGGQHRNKTQNCCRLTHIPTGITQSVQGRRRHSNYTQAKEAIIKLIEQQSLTDFKTNVNNTRQAMVGSGMRGDKRRTYRFQDDVVVDHITNKSHSCKKVMRGGFNKLWK